MRGSRSVTLSLLGILVLLSNGCPTTGGGPQPDTTPPEAVTDLAVGTVTATTVLLTWTAAGDDGDAGIADECQIRYSLAAITEDNWDSSTLAGVGPVPLAAGQPQTYLVAGLTAGTQYYLALKTIDEVGNESSLSNVVEATTQATWSTLVVNSTGDGHDFDLDDGICDDGSGNCTFRAAIELANYIPGTDTITFNIPGTGPHTIQPATELPNITDPVVIDATTEPDFAGAPVIELDGGLVGMGDGLFISAGGSTVKGLVINRFEDDGLDISDLGGNVVQGNYIGTDVTGMIARPNGDRGIEIEESSDNLIGGTDPGMGNLVSGNMDDGIRITGMGADYNRVEGNLVGTDVTGSAPLPNADDGVKIIIGDHNTIGGDVPGAGNVISGNAYQGVFIRGEDAILNHVAGNMIGTDRTGTLDLGNGQAGVMISDAATNNEVGGTTAPERNIISGNGYVGVWIMLAGTDVNVIRGNYIGTDITGTQPLGNDHYGVTISNGPNSNVVGGPDADDGNVIAFNGADGIFLETGLGNRFLRNSIFSNAESGIELIDDGVTLNDLGDADTGPNNLQNFPVLTSAVGGSSVTIGGSLNSTSSSTISLQFYANEFCDGSGYGEGQSYIGQVWVTTDEMGDVTFEETFAVPVPVGYFVTATATYDANTSEFSACLEVFAP